MKRRQHKNNTWLSEQKVEEFDTLTSVQIKLDSVGESGIYVKGLTPEFYRSTFKTVKSTRFYKQLKEFFEDEDKKLAKLDSEVQKSF